MIQTLPSDFFARVTAILLPYTRTESERENLLTEAFYLNEPRLFNQINRGGDPHAFCVQLIRTVMDFGCVQPETHALALVLNSVRYKSGVDRHAEIAALIAAVNRRCDETSPPALTALPVVTPPLSRVTPAADRTASVFVSYSHADLAITNRLITDLQQAGHAVWIDNSRIKGGDEWIESIADGINNSYAFISLVSGTATASTWVLREFLWAEYKKKPIFPVRIAECELPIYLVERQTLDLHTDYAAGLGALLDALPAPCVVAPDVSLEVALGVVSSGNDGKRGSATISRRALELSYMDRLRFQDFELEQYTVLAGDYQSASAQDGRESTEGESRHLEDATSELRRIGRAIVLGEPGAGKTWMLLAVAKPFYEAALADDRLPIPLFIKLGLWTDSRSLRDFIAEELGGLGAYLDELLHERRALLLLDGLNEIPAAARADKYAQVDAFVRAHPSQMILITCRLQDYAGDLNLDRVLIAPLDPLHVRDFVVRCLSELEGENLFWRLLPSEAHAFEERFRQQFADRLDDWLRVLWLDQQLPAGVMWSRDVTSTRTYSWIQWRAMRDQPGNLLQLARNPYLLRMLTRIYRTQGGKLPDNRSAIFREFVNSLLLREGLANADTAASADICLPNETRRLLDGLAALAWDIQLRLSPETNLKRDAALQTEQAQHFLNDEELEQATRASLLTVGSDVRFTHQLLQEYFAAVYMAAEIEAKRLPPSSIWGARWWEATHWEEVMVLLAGLYEADATPILNWVGDASPEVSALCIERSGTVTPDETKVRLGEAWQSRLTAADGDPQPEARAAIGRALGIPLLRGHMLDQRPGVGLRPDGIPDILWAFVPTGLAQTGQGLSSLAGNDELPYSYHIARYPITYAQYEAFVDDGGYTERSYWSEAGWDWRGNRMHPEYRWNDRQWHIGNHPVIGVTWFESAAFCRWLSKQYIDHDLFAELTQTRKFLTDTMPPLPKVVSGIRSLKLLDIRLPKEIEWERAARFPLNQTYPWGDTFGADRCNTRHSGLGRTTAVGIYPDAQTPTTGIHDLVGNVWEWCISAWSEAYRYPEATVREGGVDRALRGGSWYDGEAEARTASRQGLPPFYRLTTIGFRVVAALGSSL